jgi:hypothetical protein
MPDIKRLAVRADREDRRPARPRHLGPHCQPAAVAIDRKHRDLVVVLQAHIEQIRHLSSSLDLAARGNRCATLRRRPHGPAAILLPKGGVGAGRPSDVLRIPTKSPGQSEMMSPGITR